MAYQWIIPLAAALGNAILGAFVLNRDRRPLHSSFAVLTGTLVLWNLDIFGLFFFENLTTVSLWAQAFRVGPILAPTAVIAFLFLFSERSKGWRRWGVWLSLGFSSALLVANAFDLLVVRLQKLEWGYYPVGTKLYNLLSINAILALAYSSAVLVSELRSTDAPRKRVQARLWLFAAAVALPLALTNLLPVYGIHFYPLGNLANLVFVAIVAYGVVRHRLMDIDVVVTKGMAYAAVSFVLIAPAFATTIWLQKLTFDRVDSDFSAAVLGMLLAVGVLFPTLRLIAESRLERSLFPEKHEYRRALTDFTRSIVRILDRDQLIKELATTLAETLQLDTIAVALRDDGKHVFSIRHAGSTPVTIAEFSETHQLITSLMRRQSIVLRDELEESPDPIERTVVADTCRQNGWEVCIPLAGGGRLIGLIALGRKRNLDAFYSQDLDLLGTLAAEASVALENARLYDELKKSQDIIRRADRLSALGTLAAGIAHEVRNPLVSIQTFFQLAPDRLHDPEFFTTFLGMTANEVKRIADLITELLSFARSPNRSVGPVNLNESVERVATLLEPEARKHRLKMERKLAQPAPIVLADADQLKQVVINLLLNAIQATQPGGIVAVTTRSIQWGPTPAGEFEVKDTGAGMAQEQIDHIFDPFFTTKDKGTGLGLAIVHQIVMEHGGSISVESKEAYGTTFSVRLPLVDGAAVGHSDTSEAEVYGAGLRYDRPRKVMAS